MTAHELARKLLEGPDVTVVCEYDDVLVVANAPTQMTAHRHILPPHMNWQQQSYAQVPYDNGRDKYGPAEQVIVI